MSSKYPLSVHRRVERQWAERLKSLGSRIAVATERAVRHVFNDERSLIPIPARAVVDRRQVDRSQPQ
jgi:hypothetical protein